MSPFWILPMLCLSLADVERTSAAGDAGKEVRGGTALRVVSFNIRYGSADDGPNDWTSRRSLVVDTLRELAPDVAGLQEAMSFQFEEIAEALPGYRAVGVGRDDGARSGEFAPILFRGDRFELASQGTFWFSETPDVPGTRSWGNRLPRICTWVRLVDRDSGHGFYVFNLHLSHASSGARLHSVELLSDRMQKRSPAYPAIVTGDFNAQPESEVMHRLLGAGASPLIDAFAAMHGSDGESGTYHGFQGGADGPRIDYILVSPAFAVRSSEIRRSSRDGRYPSDHYPVLAELDLVAGSSPESGT